MENQILTISTEILKKQHEVLLMQIESMLNNVTHQEKDEILQPKDVCLLLNKSRQTIENWSKSGILKKRIMGDSVFYLRSEVMGALKESQEKLD